jgi:hypothetical protein
MIDRYTDPRPRVIALDARDGIAGADCGVMHVLDSDELDAGQATGPETARVSSGRDAGPASSRVDVSRGRLASGFVAWATDSGRSRSGRVHRWWRTTARPRPGTAVAAGVIGIVDIVLVVLIVVTALPRPEGLAGTNVEPSSPGGRDPVLAGKLAEQAEQVAGRDPLGELRLLLAAHIVDPESLAHKNALAEALLRSGSLAPASAVAPVKLIETSLDTSEPIRYAMVSSDGAYLLTSGATKAQLWSTREVTGEPLVELEDTLDPVLAAAAAGELTRTTLVTVHGDGVNHWVATYPVGANADGQLGPRADTVAVTADGSVAVTIDGATGTVWTVGNGVEAHGTISYPNPPTVMAFASNRGPVFTFAAGHADGSVTVHGLSLTEQRAERRVLTSSGGAIDAVAVSADASTALAVHTDGGLSVWDLGAGRAEPAAELAGAIGVGPHQAWLAPTGDFAVIGDGLAGLTLWSVGEPQRPARLRTLRDSDPAPLAGMISGDGRQAMTIDRGGELTIWSLRPFLAVIDKPTELACDVGQPDHEVWRRMVPNPSFVNPCRPAPLPELDRTPSPRPT